MRQIKRIFVHCTASPQTQTVEEIQKYWKKVKKWVNPGYHYIIKPDGEIVSLLPIDKISNGVQGYNSTAINIAYIGGINNQGRPVDNRTTAQKASLRTILNELKFMYPDAEILGHRDIWGDNPDNWKKMCPCFNAKEEYADIDGIIKDVNDPIIEEEPEEEEEHVPVPPLATPPYFSWPEEEKKEKKSIWKSIKNLINIIPWKVIFKK